MSLQNLKTNTLRLSLAVIISAFVVEFTIGVFSNSLALVTDSVHAVLDAIVTAILLVAARWATKPPDREHTYGHGKIETMGSFTGAIIILLVAFFFVFLRRALKKTDGSTLRVDFYHAFMDMGSTSVALVGILFVTLGYYQGDFIAALILGVFLAALSIKLIHKTALELTDAIPAGMVRQVQDIVSKTDGVMNTESVQMRRSGNEIFAEVKISLSGAASFEEAHKISSDVEKNIKNSIANSNVTVHFEPTWKDVPLDYKVSNIASTVKGVEGIHKVNSSSSNEGLFISLHVMVDRNMSLEEAHKISDEIESQIRNAVLNINHITIHLEPHVSIPKSLPVEDLSIEEQITKIIKEYPAVKKIGRVITFQLQNIFKIDIDCSFDGKLSIERVHDIVSEIEYKIKNQIKNAVITIHPEPS
ncbi:MAG: cation-efflux pump [Thaumarchaeota archaeon]|nr:MAG: cation-efflux pump [Nitrososphaerota archaeon]